MRWCRATRFTPYAATKRPGGAVDVRTIQYAGYDVSMAERKRVEVPSTGPRPPG